MPLANISLTSRIATTLLISIASMGMPLCYAADATRPRLVIGIMVDGLQTDYLNTLRPRFCEGGFKRLMDTGVTIANADFGPGLDHLSAAALIMTGASPSVNGISNRFTFDCEGRRLQPSLLDPEYIGNFTNETYSPRKLLVSTLADEVRIAGDGVTEVYAIAPDVQSAITLGGHSANSAFWINDTNGNWATSTFYKDVPFVVGGRNRLTPLANKLDTTTWVPSMALADYPDLPEHLKLFPFRYTFPRTRPDRFALFKTTPIVNAEVTSLATEFLGSIGLGHHDGVDMLNISYSLEPFESAKYPDARLELYDSYIRLDRNLEELLSAADRATDGNTLVFLVATPPSSSVRRDEERWSIPYGEFSTRKAGSLLNMYLMAVYGTGEWVSGFHNGHFYLNNHLIKERNIDAAAMRSQAASFIARMSGVKDVFTIDQILDGTAGEQSAALKRNTHVRTAGDIYLNVIPGWEIINDYAHGASDVAKNIVERVAPTTAPVFIIGPNIKPRLIELPVDARTVAPTVARLLRIRSPNAASVPAINLE